MKWHKWVALIAGLLSTLAMIISLVALCRCAPRCSDLGFDYVGVIVGILSLLVTILLGWNIWTIIDSKETIRKQNEKVKDCEKKYYQLISEIDRKFKKIDADNLEVFANTYCDFAKVISSDIKPLNEQKIYAIARCSVLSITSFAQANKPKESDEMIEFLCNTISKASFDTLDDNKKQKIRSNIKQCSNWKDIKNYDNLLKLIY